MEDAKKGSERIRRSVWSQSLAENCLRLTATETNKMVTECKLSEIRQIAITVSDVGTALPFYRDVLGLTFLFSPAPTLAFLAAGKVRIMVSTLRSGDALGDAPFQVIANLEPSEIGA